MPIGRMVMILRMLVRLRVMRGMLVRAGSTSGMLVRLIRRGDVHDDMRVDRGLRIGRG